MALELDRRQRAMLQEMGVQVWLPESGVAVLEQAAPVAPQATQAPGRLERPATFVPAAQAAAAALAAASAGNPTSPRSPSVPAAPARGNPAASDEVAADHAPSPDWAALASDVRDCQACGLCSGRSHTTLLAPQGAQAIACDWMVVGDPPDDEEDRAGAPFTGPPGVLLHNMLRALGLQRANPEPSMPQAAVAAEPARRAYVTNVLKCRPAHGAVPQASELAQCVHHLHSEIALVQPRIILAMGRFANQVLLAESPALAALPLGKLRGTVQHYRGIPVVVTYPPKLLMRNGADKAKAWADLCLAAATLESLTSR
jgi:DNA polymerase